MQRMALSPFCRSRIRFWKMLSAPTYKSMKHFVAWRETTWISLAQGKCNSSFYFIYATNETTFLMIVTEVLLILLNLDDLFFPWLEVVSFCNDSSKCLRYNVKNLLNASSAVFQPKPAAENLQRSHDQQVVHILLLWTTVLGIRDRSSDKK